MSKLQSITSKLRLSEAFRWLAMATLGIGLVLGVAGQSVLGLTTTMWFLGGAGFVLLMFSYVAIEKATNGTDPPPCPRCPPICAWVALLLFLLVVVACLLGGVLFGLTAADWFVSFVALSLLIIFDYTFCMIGKVAQKLPRSSPGVS